MSQIGKRKRYQNRPKTAYQAKQLALRRVAIFKKQQREKNKQTSQKEVIRRQVRSQEEAIEKKFHKMCVKFRYSQYDQKLYEAYQKKKKTVDAWLGDLHGPSDGGKHKVSDRDIMEEVQKLKRNNEIKDQEKSRKEFEQSIYNPDVGFLLSLEHFTGKKKNPQDYQ